MKLRSEDKRKVAVLCAYGMLLDGRKVLFHMAVGDKESTACWEAFLEDIKRRGLMPLLAIIDGNAGVRKAVENKLRDSLIQRCQVHKMRNVINKLPRRQIRTTNLLERLFGEGQRRSKVIPRFTSESSGLSLMFAGTCRCFRRLAGSEDKAIHRRTSKKTLFEKPFEQGFTVHCSRFPSR